MWRDWFTFSRQDRRAIIILGALLIVALGLLGTKSMWLGTHSGPSSSVGWGSDSASLSSPIVKVELHPFNPNTADSLELLSVGLSPYVTRNILRYRAAGGSFRTSDDLARIYGLHDTVFARVKPYVSIPPVRQVNQNKPTYNQEPRVTSPAKERREHPYAEYMRAKLQPGQSVDLNIADTTELMRIPGVGPVYARMIVDYRQRLGGFYSTSQLRELDMLPEDVSDWTHINEPNVKTIDINRLSVSQLRSHPYLTFYQAKAIVDLRKREGAIKSTRQLLFLNEFSDADIQRLTPYLSF